MTVEEPGNEADLSKNICISLIIHNDTHRYESPALQMGEKEKKERSKKSKTKEERGKGGKEEKEEKGIFTRDHSPEVAVAMVTEPEHLSTPGSEAVGGAGCWGE